MAAMVEIMYWELGRLNWSATDRAFPCRWGENDVAMMVFTEGEDDPSENLCR